MTEAIKLSNGISVPMEGFGVFQIPEADCERVEGCDRSRIPSD